MFAHMRTRALCYIPPSAFGMQKKKNDDVMVRCDVYIRRCVRKALTLTKTNAYTIYMCARARVCASDALGMPSGLCSAIAQRHYTSVCSAIAQRHYTSHSDSPQSRGAPAEL